MEAVEKYPSDEVEERDDCTFARRGSNEALHEAQKNAKSNDREAINPDNTLDTEKTAVNFEQDEDKPSEPDYKQLAEEQWKRASLVLESNPTLMTPEILKLALHNRPPLHVIEFMLKINPNAAGVPKSGLTALQVAVRHHASLDVVEAVIRACPFALFTSNGSYDPLTYAKIWRREEKDLIDLLSRPISYWMTPGNSRTNSSGRRKQYSCFSNEASSGFSREDKKELANIKLIAAAIIKAQKRHMAEIVRERREMKSELVAFELREQKARQDQLELFEEREKKQFKTQLVALDMKEKAFEAKLTSICRQVTDIVQKTAKRSEESARMREERQEELQGRLEEILTVLRDEIISISERAERVSSVSETQIEKMTSRLDKECIQNATHRNDTKSKVQELERRFNAFIASQYVIHTPSYPHESDRSPDIVGDEDTVPLVFHDDGYYTDCNDCSQGAVVCKGRSMFSSPLWKKKSTKKDKNISKGRSKKGHTKL